MKQITKKPCLIYCRVSSKRQMEDGNGLDSQLVRCENFAKANNYEIEKVFKEKGISGALFDRPAIQELLTYIDNHPHKQYVVIFDDLKRFARDYEVHKKLKLELSVARQVKLECLNFNFEDTPESEFIEGILALHGELERKQNRRQVIQKMKARLERGYWAFCPPPGLINKKTDEHGKILVSDEPIASILKAAIEGYEKHVFNTQYEVRDFIEARYIEVGIDKPISIHGVQSILTNPLYAGLIEYQPWEISLKKAKHDGFISPETFQNVQDKYLGRSKPKLNRSYSSDFPLRGFVTCACCGTKLRASWNKGRSKRYPNYWCQANDCTYRYRTTKSWDIHPRFESILSQAKISEGKANLAKAIFIDAWEEEKTKFAQYAELTASKIDAIDSEIASLVKRVANAKRQLVADAYELEIEKLAQTKENLEETDTTPKYTKEKFGTSLNRVYESLKNPLLLWESDSLEDKRTVLWMYFDNGLNYDYFEGFGTANFSESINLLRNPESSEFRDVEMAGSEPASAISLPTSSTSIELFKVKK